VKFVAENISDIAMPPFTCLGTLGEAKQIEMILSVSQIPRWPRQVRPCTIADVIMVNFANVKTG
jgi:hypothetical protein